MKSSMPIDFPALREQMVRTQLMARGIHDTVLLDAFRSVPREAFVAAEYQSHAYEDRPLPIESGQTISQPFVVALMIESLKLRRSDRVLDVGCGSGYAAAILACLVDHVYSIECIQTLATSAERRLQKLGCTNVHVRWGDGSQGWPEHAPYQAIVVAAAAPEVPHSLKAQMAVGARLIIPVGSTEQDQHLLRITRTSESGYHREDLGAVRFVPLIGEEGW
jgi:protein-L-isoaspartate(D-aspartate) O-methyltransferase